MHEYQGGDGPTESELGARVLELSTEAGLPAPRRQRVVLDWTWRALQDEPQRLLGELFACLQRRAA